MSATPTLTGSCARCGLCCVAEVNGVTVACEHLRHYTWVPFGKPESTFCAVYDRRYDGMPITMRAPGTILPAVCSKDSANEAAVIIARGIGKGCSLEVVA